MTTKTESQQKWLEPVRIALYQQWTSRTGHHPRASNGTWACEIAHGCRICNEHLSLPCALLAEANEIGAFLEANYSSGDPRLFFRLFLILLSEFNAQLEDVAHLVGLKLEKPPKDVALWANRWAKHRLHLLVQHHPLVTFADEHGADWQEVLGHLAKGRAVDRCGNSLPCMLIDTDWWAEEAKGMRPDLSLANGTARAVVVVPHMREFLDQTCEYFRKFIDEAIKVPDIVRQFQSPHFDVECR